jgi:hypothetical protein
MTGRIYFLGSGFISDTQYYFWYRKQGDSLRGGKTRRTEDVRIYYIKDPQTPPHMTTFRTEYKWKWARKYYWLVGLNGKNNHYYHPDFYIPEGSIQEGFSL